MPAPKQSQGQQAELRAKRYLETLGYRYITQNFRTPTGEIDLVFLDDDQLVFVEVKQRTYKDLESPLEAVTPKKIARIIKASEQFMYQFPHLPQSGRIDVIAIDSSRQPDLEHLKNVTLE